MSLPEIIFGRRILPAALLLLRRAVSLRAEIRPGDRLPRWESAGLEGQLPETTDRVLLVDFWASWCAPCKESFPELAAIHRDYAARGVTVLAVSVDKNVRAYEAFLKKQAPPFSTVRDVRQEYVTTVGVSAMPTSLVVDRDGRVRAIFAGYHGERTGMALRAALDSALAANSK
jgi:thiol-disulfide isomerase/thioredoxin